MHHSIIFLVVVLLVVVTPGTAEQAGSFLSPSSAKVSLVQRQASQARLRKSISHLAATLRSHLHGATRVNAAEYPALVGDARDLLAQQADQLDVLGGADLVRRYAARAPAYVLVMPMEHDGVEETQPIGHAVSEQTVMRTDGHGNQISQTIRCSDGHCKTTNSTNPMKVTGTGKNSGLAKETDLAQGIEKQALGSLGGFGAQQDSLHHAIAQMGKEMKAMEQGFGHGMLDDTMGSIFREVPRMKTAEHAKRSLGHSAATTKAKNVESITSETRVENGKRVTAKKICKNGHCRTEVTKQDVDTSGAGDDGDETAFGPLLARPSSMFRDHFFDDSDAGLMW